MHGTIRGAGGRAAIGTLLALALVAALSGCAAPAAGTPPEASAPGTRPPLAELAFAEDPHVLTGGSTALLEEAAIEPVAEQPAQSLPSTFASLEHAGPTELEITDTSRVIALDLSGSIAATIWGLGFGSTLVGRDQSTTFPGAAELPVVTSGGHSVNAESLIGLRPTLVITDGTVGPRDVIEQLRDVGIEVIFVANDASFAGAEQLAGDVATIYGAPAPGELLAARIRTEVEATTAEIARIAPEPGLRMMFLYLRGGSGIYYLFGEESGADELIHALGGIDVAGELGWKGMQPLSDEAIVAADPELILVMTKGLESVGGIAGLIDQVPAIGLTAAGRNERFVDMADGQILSFGPRSAGILDALARAIYAPDAG